ncbi:hypothetical protein ACFLTZ_00370 [Chloroflexota bacterium]
MASWLAVVLAVTAIYFALRRSQHTELIFTSLKFEADGGPIGLELDLHTYSHAYQVKAKARLKIDGVDYPMKLELPINAPTNFQFATVNTFHLRFSGQYEKRIKIPTTAFIDVKARLSDGSRARLRRNSTLDSSEDSNQPVLDREDSQT